MNPFSALFGSKVNVTNLSSEEFESQLKNNKNSVLIDVRTSAENTNARIPKSKLIDISSREFLDKIESLDKSKHYFVYCASGSRSYHACKELLKREFENVYNLAPGISGWSGKVERG